MDCEVFDAIISKGLNLCSKCGSKVEEQSSSWGISKEQIKESIGKILKVGFAVSGMAVEKTNNGVKTIENTEKYAMKKTKEAVISAMNPDSVPPEFISSFGLIFYQSVEGAVFKALGVE